MHPFRLLYATSLIFTVLLSLVVVFLFLPRIFYGEAEVRMVLAMLGSAATFGLLTRYTYHQRIELELQAEGLSRRVGPFPRWQKKQVTAAELRGFRIEKNVLRGDTGTRVPYDLFVELRPEGELRLMGGLKKKSAVELLESLRTAKADLMDPKLL